MNLTADQKEIARKALVDPDLYEAAVTKVHRDLSKKMTASGNVGSIGDGHILKLLLDNLPAILNAIKQILELLGLAAPSFAPVPCGGEWAPMPRGPMPQTVYPPPVAWVC